MEGDGFGAETEGGARTRVRGAAQNYGWKWWCGCARPGCARRRVRGGAVLGKREGKDVLRDGGGAEAGAGGAGVYEAPDAKRFDQAAQRVPEGAEGAVLTCGLHGARVHRLNRWQCWQGRGRRQQRCVCLAAELPRDHLRRGAGHILSDVADGDEQLLLRRIRELLSVELGLAWDLELLM